VISPEEKRRRRIEKHLGQAAERAASGNTKPLNELLAACPTCGTAMHILRADVVNDRLSVATANCASGEHFLLLAHERCLAPDCEICTINASHGVAKPKPQPVPPPAPIPAAEPCKICGSIHSLHSPEQAAEAERLATEGILEARSEGPDGDLRFRGDIDQCPGGPKRGRGFLIGAGVDKGLSDGRWHRVEFARLPNWRGRRELRLYRADETKPLMARLLSAFSDVFQPDGFISTQ
jgi:hypothetical protein